MFCVYCGTENPDSGCFCRNCGKPLVKDALGVRTQQGAEGTRNDEIYRGPKGIGGWLLFLCIS